MVVRRYDLSVVLCYVVLCRVVLCCVVLHFTAVE